MVFLHSDEIDEQCLKIIADSWNKKLGLFKSLDKEIIEICQVEEITNEIEEPEDINLRVLFMLQSIMPTTSSKSNDKGISTMEETNGDETAPSTSLQLTTGPQTTNVSENVDSENTQLVQNKGSSTGDVNQPPPNSRPRSLCTAMTGKFCFNSMWWCGPQFLQFPKEEWPQEQATVETNEAVL